jgi:hypothetical protein
MLQPTYIPTTAVCTALPEALITVRVEIESLPREEGDVLATALLAAAYLAGQGRPEDGYRCLRACARRAELAHCAGETWAGALAARYREVMDGFAARHRLGSLQ